MIPGMKFSGDNKTCFVLPTKTLKSLKHYAM